MRSRNEQEKAERRETLLNAAETVFFKKGFEATSMDDIANEAGFSRALLYVYFKDKKGIYQALRVRSSQALHDRMIKYSNEHDKGIDKIKATGYAYYHFYLQERHFFNCLTLNISLNNQSKNMERSEEGIECEKAIMTLMVDAIELGIKDGSLNSNKVQNPLETALFLRGSLHGMILMHDHDKQNMLHKSGIDKDKFITNGIDRVVESLS